VNLYKSTKAERAEFNKDFIVVLFLAFAAAIILSPFINSPFKGNDHDGAGGCLWGTIARNYIRYGLAGTKLGMVENGGFLKTSEFRYYTHHPPLIPIILSAGLRVTGVHEWSIRMIFIIFAIAAMILLYFLSKELWSRKVALLSCVLMFLTPMYLHFSSVPDMTSVTIFFSVATVYAYARWIKTNSMTAITVMSVMLMLANFSAWEAYYLIPAILVHNFLRDKKKIINILVPALGIVTFLSYVIHILMLVGIEQLMMNAAAAKWRTGISTISENPLFILTYIKQIVTWIWLFFTPFLVLLSLLFLVIYFGCSKEKRREKNYDFIALFFIFAIARFVVFSQLCYYHQQRLYYFIPFFVLSSSLAIEVIFEKAKQTTFKLSLIFLVIISVILTTRYITQPVILMLHEDDARRFFKLSEYKFHNNDSYEIKFYDSLKDYIQTTLGPKDILLSNCGFNPQLRFYLDRNANENVTSMMLLQESLKNARVEKKRTLFIFCNRIEKSSDDAELLAYLRRNSISYKSFSGTYLLVFDLNRL